ncbi:oligosaccharide flippase family protein [Palleronia sp. LCG004]|uniref:oligosaccharide flippase family protein n=1 Tax=Palleronia sp. LCG004 TaxID=3079304 RepID=UPI002943E55E|nr:oligosaccharide flippase family protein [Palleronia sp. LCG004]WOI55703.1 oligosaccharide flippase family protein [Palleronia sp. LCG004]
MSARRAFLSMMASRAVSLLIMLVGMAALGRLLDPEAFGHFAVLMAYFGLAKTLSEFGLRSYLVRTADISGRELSGATGLSLAISAAICGLGVLLFLGLPNSLVPAEMALAALPLALALLVSNFSLGTEMLLHRGLDFDLISQVSVGRVIAESGISIFLAAMGYGATALAWGFLAGHLAFGAALFLCRGPSDRIWPGIGGWRDYATFGTRLSTTQVLPSAGEIAVTSIVSVMLGTATMGLLNRAQTIQKIIDRTLFEGILPVVLPAMSAALARGVPPMQLYSKQIDYLVAICWPGFAVIALLADPLVYVLLGPNWDETVAAVRLLAIAGVAMPFTKMSLKLFVALGLESVYLRITIAMQITRVVFVAVAALISFNAVCLAISLALITKAVNIAWAVETHVGRGADRLWAASRGVLLAVATCIGPAIILLLGLDPFLTVVLSIPVCAAFWTGTIFALDHPLAAELRMLGQNLRTRHRVRG